MTTDKALCYFQPTLKAGAVTGIANLNQIREAASALALNCGARKDQGGIATNIGTSHKERRPEHLENDVNEEPVIVVPCTAH